jgi:hypothetical protein
VKCLNLFKPAPRPSKNTETPLIGCPWVPSVAIRNVDVFPDFIEPSACSTIRLGCTPVTVAVAVSVAVAVGLGVDVLVAVALPGGGGIMTTTVLVAVGSATVAVAVGVLVAVSVPVGVAVGVPVLVAVAVLVAVGRSVPVGVGLAVTVGVDVSVATAVSVGVEVEDVSAGAGQEGAVPLPTDHGIGELSVDADPSKYTTVQYPPSGNDPVRAASRVSCAESVRSAEATGVPLVPPL